MKDIEDEIPFEVPEGWAWCRLGTLGYWKSGSTPAKTKKEYYENGTINWLNTSDLNNGFITNIPKKITSLAQKECNLQLFPVDSVCIAMYGATIGKIGILKTETTTNQACCVCSDFKGISNIFLFYFLMQHKKEFIEQGFGGAQPNISKDKITNTLIPLPPLDEQNRIISRVETIFNEIKLLEASKADLKAAIKHAKSKVLDLAIHGKLVPQDSSEEPARNLLERIRAEKEAKIAAGELKRDKNDSYIYKNPSDNCHYEKFGESKEELLEDPFEIPTEWTWIRLTNICEYIGDGDWIESKDQASEGIRLIQTGNVGNGKFRNKAERSHFISEKTFDKLNCTEIFPGDILISRLPEPVGRSCIIPDIKQRMITAVDCSILRLNENIILPEYFCYYTQSSAYFSLIQEKCTGTTRLRISRANLEKILLPLPNKIEQKRIIEKVREIFTTLDIIESKLQ